MSSSTSTVSTSACTTSQRSRSSSPACASWTTRGGTGDGHEHVDALQQRDGEQRLGITRRGGFGHAVERVDRTGEPVSGEPVLRRLDEHHPVPGRVERPRQLKRLGHLPAGDQHRPWRSDDQVGEWVGPSAEPARAATRPRSIGSVTARPTSAATVRAVLAFFDVDVAGSGGLAGVEQCRHGCVLRISVRPSRSGINTCSTRLS